MQQTAVEWLEKELKDRYALMQSEPLFQQAKEIEKERDFQFFKAGQDSMEEGGKSFDQLYQSGDANEMIDQFGDANKMVKLCPYFCYVICECEDVKICAAKENEKKLNNNIK